MLNYKIQVPTPLDFLKDYMIEVLDIHILSKTETLAKETSVLKFNGIALSSDEDEITTNIKEIDCDR